MSKLNLIVLLSIATLTFSLQANATHIAKGLSGAACQTARNTDTVFRSVSGKMYNKSTRSQYWTCPIVKSDMGGNIRNAEVYVINRKGRFTCVLHSRDKFGGNILSRTISTTRVASTVQRLPRTNFVEGRGFGVYDFRCKVPGISSGGRSSAVVDYLWDEHR